MKGKTVTIILLVSIFVIGMALIVFAPDRFDLFLSLVGVVLVPMLVIMGGIAGQSIAKVIKGEAKIEDVKGGLLDLSKVDITHDRQIIDKIGNGEIADNNG
jgi:hypothetical protein